MELCALTLVIWQEEVNFLLLISLKSFKCGVLFEHVTKTACLPISGPVESWNAESSISVQVKTEMLQLTASRNSDTSMKKKLGKMIACDSDMLHI